MIVDQNRRDGRTILLVEQNARAGLFHGAVLNVGTVELVGAAGSIVKNPEMARLYLGAS